MAIIDVSAVPLPPEETKEEVKDELGSPGAFKFGFIGIGQCGCRLAKQFHTYGYRKVCAINTAKTDLDPLELPITSKLLIGDGGAGGNPEYGRKCATEAKEPIFNLMRNCFGEDIDRIMIAAAAGGGTGSGGVAIVSEVTARLIDKLELREEGDSKVGLILALPKESDGRQAHKNAFYALKEILPLVPGKISPLILIDNQRIDRLYPKTPIAQFWNTANSSVCSIFHLLNIIANQQSEYTSFDKADYKDILNSGLLAFGAMPVAKWDSREDISNAIRDRLFKNVLVGGLDFSTGKVAGCILVANADVLKTLPQENIDYGFSMLGRMIDGGVHRGIYAGNALGIVVYSMIGGMSAPTDRINELRKLGNLQDFDGV